MVPLFSPLMERQNYASAPTPEVQDHLGDTPNPALDEPKMDGHAATPSANEPKGSSVETASALGR